MEKCEELFLKFFCGLNAFLVEVWDKKLKNLAQVSQNAQKSGTVQPLTQKSGTSQPDAQKSGSEAQISNFS